MKKISQAFFCFIFLIIFSVSFLMAGNGKIAGVVKDSLGKPVPGASVMLSGEKHISSTDAEGRYFILNVPPGKYDVIVNAIGYNKKKIISVEVISDLTTELNVLLESASVEVEEIAVNADRNLINKTMASSKTVYSADDLAKTFPTSNTFEILQTSPGIYKGFLRGGLQNQTKFLVDGIDISDSYYSAAYDEYAVHLYQYHAVSRYRESQLASLINVNPNSISELSVNTGALGADDFSASAGVINYSLKEGKGKLSGKINIKTGAQKLGIAGPDVYNDKDSYFAAREYLLNSASSNYQSYGKLYNWTENSYENGHVPFEADISLSGGITDKLGFFFSADYKKNPDCRLPNQRYKEVNSQIKLTYDLAPDMKITALGMLTDKGKLFGWKNSDYAEAWKYYLEGVPQNDGLNWIGSLKFTHYMSDKLFYEIQISNKNSNTRTGYVDGNNDGLLQLNEEGDFITWTEDDIKRYTSSYDFTKSFEIVPAGGELRLAILYQYLKGAGGSSYYFCKPDIYYENFKNNVLTGKLDVTYQIMPNHQLKSGFSYLFHDLDMNRVSAYLVNQYPYSEVWNVKPSEFGAYIQDKMEYDNLAINVGLRFDSWNPKAADFKDYNNPYNMVVNSYILGTYTSLVPNRGENIKTYNYLSPRIAVSYQFLNNISVYSSFSKTFQPPPFSLVYSGYSKFSFLTTHRSSDNLSANRQPYKTTNYEVGTQWKISDMFALEVSAYSIDYHNYFDSSRLIKQASPLYYLHYSAGIAHSKGIEFTLEGIPTDVANFLKISGRLSYTYSKVKGDENLLGGSSNLTSGYNRDHRVVYTLSMLFPYDISVTSIGTFQSGFWYLKQLGGDEYAQGPWNKQIDLRIEKAFKISTFKLAVYMDVRNLFNTENIIAYDNSSTGYEVWEKNSDPTGQYNHSVSADGSLYYDIPREVYLGVSLDF